MQYLSDYRHLLHLFYTIICFKTLIDFRSKKINNEINK